MNKIRRVFLSNLGHKDSFFGGDILELIDAEGNPVDTVLHGANGFGKTTILAVILNTIDTDRGRYLRTLKKKNEKFEHNFTDTPSCIAIEWDNAAGGRVFVTAQIILPVPGKAGIEYDRHFISWYADETLPLEILPFPGIGGRRWEDRVRKRDDVIAWLSDHVTRYRDSHDFNRFDIQSDWRKHLISNGIDVELIANQVDLNNSEGGIDTFVNFASEEAFLTRFWGMTLNSQKAAEVRADLDATIRSMAGYDQLQTRLDLISALKKHHDLFLDHATALRDIETQRDILRSRIAGLHNALTERSSHVKAQVDDLDDECADLSDEIAGLSNHKRQLAIRVDALSHAVAHAQNEQAAANLEQATEARDNAAKDCRVLKAADRWSFILGKDIRAEALNKRISAATTSIDDERRAANKAGATLHAAIEIRSNEAKIAAKELRGKAINLEGRKTGIKADLEQEQRQSEEALGAINQGNEWFRIYDLTLADLRKRGIIQPEQSPAGAVQAITTEIERLEERLAILTSKIDEANNMTAKAEEYVETCLSAKAEANATFNERTAKLNTALEEKRSIVEDPLTREIFENDTIDPDNTAVASHLTTMTSTLSAEIAALEDTLAIKNADADSIRANGLAGIDSNVSTIVEALHKAGIRDALPFAGWLAGIGTSPADMRRFAAADPARFSGVAIQGDAAWKVVTSLDLSAVPLTRAVTISRASTDTSEPGNDRIVIALSRDEAYDTEAAARLLESLDQERDKIGQKISNKQSRRSQIDDLVKRIDLFRRAWGGGKLFQIAQQKRMAEDALATAIKNLETAKTGLTDAKTEAERLRQDLHGVTLTRNTAGERLADATRFVQTWEDAVPEKRNILETAQRAHNEHKARAETLGTTLDTVGEEIARANSEAADQDRLVRDFATRLSAIAMHDAEPDPIIEVRLTELQTDYEQAYEAYRTLEQNRVGDLSTELKEIQRSRKELYDSYINEFGDLEDRQADIEHLAARGNLDSDLSIAEAREQSAEKSHTEAAFNHRTTKATLQKLTSALSSEAKKIRTGLVETPDNSFADQHEAAETDLKRTTHDLEIKTRVRDDKAALSAKLLTEYHALEAHTGTLPVHPGIDPMPVTLDPDLGTIATEVKALVRRNTEIDSQVDGSLRKAEQAFETVRRHVDADDFKKVESSLSSDIRHNGIREAVTNAATHNQAIVDIIATIQHEIGRFDENRRYMITRLDDFLNDAQRKLRRAINTKIPDSLPRLGGLHVIKMKPGFPNKSEIRHNVIDKYLRSLTRDRRIPEKGHLIAVEIMHDLREEVGWKSLGIEIIKPNDAGDLQYFPIHMLGSSDGQGLTAAMLLYLILVKLRAESLADSKSAFGGVLFADNPFGKASHPLLLRVQRDLARAMNIQLVFTMSGENLDALGEFPHVLRIKRKGQRGNKIVMEIVQEHVNEPDLSAVVLEVEPSEQETE